MSADELWTAADQLQTFAVERFDAHGPHDARGAALWDAAAWLREDHAPSAALVPDPLRRRTLLDRLCWWRR